MGAPIGNRNNSKGKMFNDALRRQLIQSPERIAKIVEVLIGEAEQGQAWAIKEIIDRIDGKPTQFIETDMQLMTGIEVSFVKPKNEYLTQNFALLSQGSQ
ncbi:hypothetical protein [Polynucleobacter rarus]|uniref:hypothetical protein n=1 Tax=Polynucleobacter rarus TaxID=556055 RepID=UPI000D3EBFFE|nr:hypothetical protein [Polynucleobacter rarus]